jgi:hypothetical protein
MRCMGWNGPWSKDKAFRKQAHPGTFKCCISWTCCVVLCLSVRRGFECMGLYACTTHGNGK